MEDVCSCQYPLPGVEQVLVLLQAYYCSFFLCLFVLTLALQFGLFGIFDGHGGVGAAKAASK